MQSHSSLDNTCAGDLRLPVFPESYQNEMAISLGNSLAGGQFRLEATQATSMFEGNM